MQELRDEKLDFWIQNQFNVLFIGRHGVGKSTRIFEAFKRAKLNYKYYSAPTLDPWVDFVGVPKEVEDEKGPYIDLVLPKNLRDDTIDAIFMDELNRGHAKIQNAVLELIQFRSINGRKFNNLKFIWASINPEGEKEYKTEDLDPALKDRFVVWCDVPYEPKKEWFVEQFGERLGQGAVSWWDELGEAEKKIVTPRRLQYALDMYKANGDVRDVLPPGCNVTKLLSNLSTGPISQKLQEIYEANNPETARRFLMVENQYTAAIKHLQSPHEFNIAPIDWFSFWIPVMPNEKLSSLLATSDQIFNFVVDHPDLGKFADVIEAIVSANQNKALVRKIQKRLGSLATNSLAGRFGRLRNVNAEPSYFSNKKGVDWDAKLVAYNQMPMMKTPERGKVYVDLISHLPEVMRLDQALDTLEILGSIANRTWPQKLKDYRHFMGAVNHCIKEVHRTSALSWSEMLKRHPSKFEKLVNKLAEGGMDKKLFCPVSTTETISAKIGSPEATSFLSE